MPLHIGMIGWIRPRIPLLGFRIRAIGVTRMLSCPGPALMSPAHRRGQVIREIRSYLKRYIARELY